MKLLCCRRAQAEVGSKLLTSTFLTFAFVQTVKSVAAEIVKQIKSEAQLLHL
jgi:hypothetical protein